jgi:hypothetical protein
MLPGEETCRVLWQLGADVQACYEEHSDIDELLRTRITPSHLAIHSRLQKFDTEVIASDSGPDQPSSPAASSAARVSEKRDCGSIDDGIRQRILQRRIDRY